MSNCILVVNGLSQYDVLVRASQEIAEGFRQFSDLPVLEIDISEDDGIEKFEELLENTKLQPEFIFFMQAVLFNYKKERDILPLVADLPCVSLGWIFDYPRYHLSRIESMAGDQMLLAMINRSDLELVRRYFHVSAKQIFFLPHGGFLPKYKPLPFSQRIHSVFFSGGYSDGGEIFQRLMCLPESFQYLVKRWIRKFQTSDLDKKIYHHCLEECIQEIGMQCTDEELMELWLELTQIVDQLIRIELRTAAIQSLLAAGIPVAVVGKGWEKFTCKNRELLVVLAAGDGVPIDEVIRLMGNFQMVLNISESLSQGGHERVPTAMLSGSVCLSTPSTYLLQKYKDKEEILYYDPQNLSTLSEAVHWVWQHPAEAERLTQRAYDKALAEDTWQMRAKEILDIIEQRKALFPHA